MKNSRRSEHRCALGVALCLFSFPLSFGVFLGFAQNMKRAREEKAAANRGGV